jgi:hypothetical protein
MRKTVSKELLLFRSSVEACHQRFETVRLLVQGGALKTCAGGPGLLESDLKNRHLARIKVASSVQHITFSQS